SFSGTAGSGAPRPLWNCSIPSRPHHLSVARNHFADDPGGYLRFVTEVSGDRLGVILGHDHDQADSHVENAKHLGFVHRSEPLKPGENGWNLPRPALETDREAFGKNAWRIVDQASAGDMGNRMHG